MLRGKAVTLAILIVTSTVGFTAPPGMSSADTPHGRILIDEPGDFTAPSATSGCRCVTSGSGTQADPFIISDWQIKVFDGWAIEVEDIDNIYFTIRDNSLDAPQGIRLDNVGDRGQILGNDIIFSSDGIITKHASPRIVDNQLQGPTGVNDFNSMAMKTTSGSPIVKHNVIVGGYLGLYAQGASLDLVNNTFKQNYNAITLTESADAELHDNTVTRSRHWGIVVTRSADAELYDNTIGDGEGGIIANDATLYMEGNLVTDQDGEAVRFLRSSVTMYRNEVVDNWRGAFGARQSDVNLVENTFTNNQESGILFEDVLGTVKANRIEHNDVGISLQRTIAIDLIDNKLYNNTYGFSIPYESRQAILGMSGNIVNGVNIDGEIRPDEQRVFYDAENVRISGQLIDSGNSKGFSGTNLAQGEMLIYDSDDVKITNNRFVHVDRGILIKSSDTDPSANSRSIHIQDNVFFEVQQGVVIRGDVTAFVKNNTCEIEVDPDETFCVRASGDGFVAIGGNLIINFDIGIHLVADHGITTKADVHHNTVVESEVGIRAEGTSDQSEHRVMIRANALENNTLGLELDRFQGEVKANLIANNTWAGVHLTARTNATFTANVVVDNEGAGIIDIDTCSDRYRHRCSSGVFVDNRVEGNAGVGIEVHDGGLFEGGVVADNEVGLKITGRAKLAGLNSTNNDRDGLRAEGEISIRKGNYTKNGGNGLIIRGDAFLRGLNASDNRDDGAHVEGMARVFGGTYNNNSRIGIESHGRANMAHFNASGNFVAGLRLNGTVFRLFDCEASLNGDGILMAEALVEVRVGPPSVNLPTIEIPGVPNVPSPDLGEEEETDPLWMTECNIALNAEFALKASANTVINATGNFWGTDGPKVDVPLFPERNTIEAAGLFTPYWVDREHTNCGVLPTTTFGPSADLVTCDHVRDAVP